MGIYMDLYLQFSMVETLVSGVMDAFPKYFRGKHLTVIFGITTFGLIIGLVFCTKVMNNSALTFSVWTHVPLKMTYRFLASVVNVIFISPL